MSEAQGAPPPHPRPSPRPRCAPAPRGWAGGKAGGSLGVPSRSSLGREEAVGAALSSWLLDAGLWASAVRLGTAPGLPHLGAGGGAGAGVAGGGSP